MSSKSLSLSSASASVSEPVASSAPVSRDRITSPGTEEGEGGGTGVEGRGMRRGGGKGGEGGGEAGG